MLASKRFATHSKNKNQVHRLTTHLIYFSVRIERGDHANLATINNTGKCIGPSGS
jgi:hypothetical protein